MSKREQNREKKQAAILVAALTVFSRKGYAAAKIIDIARAANVGKGTIYEYHRSKEDLFFALFQWYVERLAGGTADPPEVPEGNAEDQLKHFFSSTLNAFYGEIDTFGVFFEFWAAAGNPATRDRFRSAMLSMYHQFRTMVVDLINQGKDTGLFRKDTDAFSVAAGLVGTMDGMMLQAWMDREFDVLTASGQFLDTLIAGMKS
ncbi:MAG: TetR/AcrR family transcriptional regulator [Desulfobacterales bacterium]|nr:TetR/AcrR family transcriptional regulator [Desulfobacterales bacterium]